MNFSEGRQRLRPAMLVVAAFLVTYLATMSTARISNDATTSSLGAWQLAATGAPWLEDVDYSSLEHPDFLLWIGPGADGHLVPFRSPGSILAAVPAYGVARLLGASDFSLAPGSVTAALLTAVAMGLFFAAMRPKIGARWAMVATAALGLATPVWSVSADSMWTHPVTLVGIAGMAFASSRDDWWLAGMFGGIALWGRLHMALPVAILGLGVALARRDPRIAVKVGIPSLTALGLASLWGHWLYGGWSPSGGYDVAGYTQRATDSSDVLGRLVNHVGMWVAPDRGILVWTPVLVLLVPAVIRSWKGLPAWSRWLAIGGLAYLLVQAQLNAFLGGSGFYGYRLSLEFLVSVAPVLVLSVQRAGRFARAALGPVIGLQFAAISIGAANGGGVLRESKVWTDNSFVHIMSLAPPLLIWPVLMILAGSYLAWDLGRRWAQGYSAVPPGDQLDRV